MSKETLKLSPTQRYIGIRDRDGIESICALEDSNPTYMELRCRYSSGGQNREMWGCFLDDAIATKIADLIQDNPDKATEVLSQSQSRQVGVAQVDF